MAWTGENVTSRILCVSSLHCSVCIGSSGLHADKAPKFTFLLGPGICQIGPDEGHFRSFFQATFELLSSVLSGSRVAKSFLVFMSM